MPERGCPLRPCPAVAFKVQECGQATGKRRPGYRPARRLPGPRGMRTTPARVR